MYLSKTLKRGFCQLLQPQQQILKINELFFQNPLNLYSTEESSKFVSKYKNDIELNAYKEAQHFFHDAKKDYSVEIAKFYGYVYPEAEQVENAVKKFEKFETNDLVHLIEALWFAIPILQKQFKMHNYGKLFELIGSSIDLKNYTKEYSMNHKAMLTQLLIDYQCIFGEEGLEELYFKGKFPEDLELVLASDIDLPLYKKLAKALSQNKHEVTINKQCGLYTLAVSTEDKVYYDIIDVKNRSAFMNVHKFIKSHHLKHYQGYDTRPVFIEDIKAIRTDPNTDSITKALSYSI